MQISKTFCQLNYNTLILLLYSLALKFIFLLDSAIEALVLLCFVVCKHHKKSVLLSVEELAPVDVMTVSFDILDHTGNA